MTASGVTASPYSLCDLEGVSVRPIVDPQDPRRADPGSSRRRGCGCWRDRLFLTGGGARSALSEFGELALEVAHLLLELIGGLSNGDFDWPTFTVKPRWLMTFFRYGSSGQSTTAAMSGQSRELRARMFAATAADGVR